MSLERKIAQRARRRAQRVRSKLSQDKPRVSVFRSLNHIYVQLIDDAKAHTLTAASSLGIANKKGAKADQAHAVGKQFAQQAMDLGVKNIIFDRGSCKYHGRVKSLAEGMREGGLEF